jgi:hypothetical protein
VLVAAAAVKVFSAMTLSLMTLSLAVMAGMRAARAAQERVVTASLVAREVRLAALLGRVRVAALVEETVHLELAVAVVAILAAAMVVVAVVVICVLRVVILRQPVAAAGDRIWCLLVGQPASRQAAIRRL